MIYFIVGLSTLLFCLGFLVNHRNARYLLSGYNTLSKEEQEKFDITGYLLLFKRFHVFLGASMLIIGLLLCFLVSGDASMIFVSGYPILAYTYLVVKGRKYNSSSNARWKLLPAYILAGVFLFVMGLMWMGCKTSTMTIENHVLKISGMYNENITFDEIRSFKSTDTLPEIKWKLNGFALSTIKKGYFKTRNGEKIKLILNSLEKPFIVIEKKSGLRIFYSLNRPGNLELIDLLNQELPAIAVTH